MSVTHIRDVLIAQGVKNMKEFGYPHVNAINIISDPVYKMFFKSMLKENLGLGHDIEINKLLLELD